MASSFMRFLDHTQRRTTVGRTLLDPWSARRRDPYLKTHDTRNRQTSMPPAGLEPMMSAGERPQTYALDRAATGIGHQFRLCSLNWPVITFSRTFSDKQLLEYELNWFRTCKSLTVTTWGGGSGGVTSRIHYAGTVEEWVISSSFHPLYPRGRSASMP